MAQSKYMLATYSQKPGWVNKHWIISDYVLTTCSWKSSRVNERRFIKNIISLMKGGKTWQIKAYENL